MIALWTDIPVRVGIARTKTLAKIASKFAKLTALGVTTPLQLSETLDRMNQKYGIRTVGLAVAGSNREAWKNKKDTLRQTTLPTLTR